MLTYTRPENLFQKLWEGPHTLKPPMIPRGERKGKEESEISNSIIVLGGENQKKEVRPVILSLFFGGEADTETKKRKWDL